MVRLMDEIISELYRYHKNGIPYRLIGADYDLRDRSERITVVSIILDSYDTNETDQQKLSDFLVIEELTDTHPDKITREEYPFLSDTQLARRRYGVHRKNDGNGIREVPYHLAENYGTDGRNYNYPERRKWTWKEGMYVDDNAVSRNKVRRKTHREFITGKSPGIFTVNIKTGEKTIHDKEKYSDIYWE